MKSITIRAFQDDLYETLKNWAKINHRSLQEQVKYILTRELKLVNPSQLALASQWRNKLKNKKLGNIVQEIRADRDR
jgi:plasmid stability protein